MLQAHASTSWADTAGGWLGNGESFIFSIQPKMAVFHATGKDENFQVRFSFELKVAVNTMGKKFNLEWKYFSNHLVALFKNLVRVGRFADVTLVSDDMKQFHSHKIVLSACSPVLEKLILNNTTR